MASESARPCVASKDFTDAMRRAASGVSVVTTDGPIGRGGITVSAFSALSADPPSAIVCIHRLSAALEPILGNRVFCVNILSAAQSDVAECFAGRIPHYRHDKFESADWITLATGAPVLEGAAAALDCGLAENVLFGSHRILLGAVLKIRTEWHPPLVYWNRDYRSIADGTGLHRALGA